ncbi:MULTISPECIES: transglycosylase SLT domain-containing protein [Acetobacter]|uniref:transglycosylase SLT domain-containing protein n=1 Tax=Acetobacter TaxID=434 RepID=UPI00376F5CB5
MTDPAQAAQLAQRLSQLGVSDGIDIKTGQINDISKFYQNLAENRTKLANAPRVGLLQDIGLDQGSIDLVLKGGSAVKSTFSTYESFGKRMQENAEASEKLQARYKELIEQNRVYAQELEGNLLPALTSITGAMSDFEKRNPGLTKGLIGTSAAIAGVGTAILGVLSIVGGVRFLRALKSIERLAEGGKIAGGAEKAGEAVAETAKEAAPVAARASRAARIGRIASRAFGGLNLAADAYMAGDLFWNGASPSLSKNDTNNAAKKMFLSKLDAQYGLPAGFMDAIWARESSRGTNAKPSSAGALGDFQIMPGVAKEAGVDPMNFEQAARYAAKRFHNNFANYGGSLSASIAEYNWGDGNLSKSMSQYGGDWQAHAPRETQNYISGVSAALEAVRGMPRGGADASQNTTHNTVNVGEIKIVSPSPERAGDAVQRKIVEMRTAASFSNSGAA